VEDPRALLRRGPMSGFQIAAVTICMIVNMLDGFDVLATTFTGPTIARDWAVMPTQLGLLFSAGLLGMTVGSLFISPIADAIGRRWLTLIGLVVITVGMLASSRANGLVELALFRVFTGLGIGSLLSSINTIVVEFSSTERKEFAVSFMAVGYPIGGTIGGMIAVYLIHAFGWRSVFLFGAVCSAVLVPIAYAYLPESLDFLLFKRPRNALARINNLLTRMGQPMLDGLPELQDPAAQPSASIFSIFDRAFVGRTALVCSAYFLTMLPFYFVLSWTPKVLVDEGLSLSIGISGSIVMNATGVVGGLLFGLLARRSGLKRLCALFMLLLLASIVAFGFAGSHLLLLMIFAMAIGFSMIGTICGLYAIIGAMYPVRIRNTGTGLAIGIGRLGAIAGPSLAGVLIGAGWSRPLYCVVLSLPLLVSAFLVRRVPLLDEAAS